MCSTSCRFRPINAVDRTSLRRERWVAAAAIEGRLRVASVAAAWREIHRAPRKDRTCRRRCPARQLAPFAGPSPS
jgi:hypothetical protein